MALGAGTGSSATVAMGTPHRGRRVRLPASVAPPVPRPTGGDARHDQSACRTSFGPGFADNGTLSRSSIQLAMLWNNGAAD